MSFFFLFFSRSVRRDESISVLRHSICSGILSALSFYLLRHSNSFAVLFASSYICSVILFAPSFHFVYQSRCSISPCSIFKLRRTLTLVPVPYSANEKSTLFVCRLRPNRKSPKHPPYSSPASYYSSLRSAYRRRPPLSAAVEPLSPPVPCIRAVRHRRMVEMIQSGQNLHNP